MPPWGTSLFSGYSARRVDPREWVEPRLHLFGAIPAYKLGRVHQLTATRSDSGWLTCTRLFHRCRDG
jgi:hypothetical protein